MFGPFDKELELRAVDDDAITATATETGILLPVTTFEHFAAIVDVKSVDVTTNEAYNIEILVDSALGFSSPVVIPGAKPTAPGRFIVPLMAAQIEKLDAAAKAITVRCTISGTAPSIEYGCWLTPTS